MRTRDYFPIAVLVVRMTLRECLSLYLLAYTGYLLIGWPGPVLAVPASIPIVHAMSLEIVPYVRTKKFYTRARVYTWFLFSLALFISSLSGVFAFLSLVPSLLFWDRMFAGRIRDLDLDLVKEIMGK